MFQIPATRGSHLTNPFVGVVHFVSESRAFRESLHSEKS